MAEMVMVRYKLDLLLMVEIHYNSPGLVVVFRCFISKYTSKEVDLATSLDSVDRSNAYDFYMSWANNLGIYGGRYRSRQEIFIYSQVLIITHAVKIDNVQLGAYSPPDGIVFQMDSPGTLQMGAVTVNDFMLTGPVVRLGYNGVNVGNFQWTGGYVQGTMTNLYPFNLCLTGRLILNLLAR